MAVRRQVRRPTVTRSQTGASGAGKGIDFLGGPVIDPTENVLALHDAEAKHRDDLRAADERYFNAKHEAEAKRIDDLAHQRSEFNVRLSRQKDSYDQRIAEMLRAQTQSDSALVAKQLDRLINTYDARIGAVERSQYESGGKAAVMDPTVAEALKALAVLKSGAAHQEGQGAGQGQVVAWIAAGIGILVGIFSIIQYISLLASRIPIPTAP